MAERVEVEEGDRAYLLDKGRRCGLVVVVDKHKAEETETYTVIAFTKIINWDSFNPAQSQKHPVGHSLIVPVAQIQPLIF